MKRRAFLLAALLLPHATAGAPKDRYLVAVYGRPPADPSRFREAFARRGLKVGDDVRIEFVYEQDVASTARSIVALRPHAAIVFSTQMAKAVGALTTSTPIVFVAGADPVANGLVKSYAAPGGNLTGVVVHGQAMIEKRVEAARELLPGAKRAAWLAHLPSQEIAIRGAREAMRKMASAVGLELIVADTEPFAGACKPALARVGSLRPDVVLVEGPFTKPCANILAELDEFEVEHRIPVISDTAFGRGIVQVGVDMEEVLSLYVEIVVRILRGDAPGTIPIARPNRFVLVLDLARAQRLGIAVPQSLILRADRIVR